MPLPELPPTADQALTEAARVLRAAEDRLDVTATDLVAVAAQWLTLAELARPGAYLRDLAHAEPAAPQPASRPNLSPAEQELADAGFAG